LQEYDGGQFIRPVDMITEVNAPGKINLYWSDRSNAETGYQIWRATGGTQFSLLATVGANVSTYTDNTAATNIRYYYKVKALNGSQSSEFSNVASQILGSNLVLVNLSTSSISQGSPWNNARAVPLEGSSFTNLTNTGGRNTGVALRIMNNFGGNFDQGMTGTGVIPSNVMQSSWWVEGGGPTGTLRLANLNQSKRYRIGIMGSSSWSGDFTASYTINDKVAYLNAHQNSSKLVYIDDVVPDQNGQVFITMGTMPGARYGFWSALTLESYDVDNAAPAGMDNSLTKTSSRLSSDVMAQEDKVISNITVYPNPFNDALTVNITGIKGKKLSLLLFDTHGKLVYTKELGSVDGTRSVKVHSGELSKAVPGTYFMQVVADGKLEKSIKLIKLK
jgi:hypothetical protein